LKCYVLDASVVCRFLLAEDLSDKAEEVLRDFLEGRLDLMAPKLVVYEVGNTLWRAVSQGLLHLEEALEKLSYLSGLGIASIELGDDEHAEALRLSVRKEATYYDSVYVVSAKTTSATLLTADDDLCEKARGEVLTTHLKDYR